VPRVPGRIVAMASADAPMKGIATLLEAVAKLLTEREVELILVSRPTEGGRTERLVEKLGIGDRVRFVHGISDADLVDVMGSAEVACVPSLYEGFSLPTAELMACETPIVASRAGAIPEVVGPDGECAVLVTPGDVGELVLRLRDLLDDPDRRARMGAAGRRRVLDHFSWRAVAVATTAAYERVIAEKVSTSSTTGETGSTTGKTGSTTGETGSTTGETGSTTGETDSTTGETSPTTGTREIPVADR